MPIDMNLFRSLPVDQQNRWEEALTDALSEKLQELTETDAILKNAMGDKSTNLSDLTPLLNYREEIKKNLDQLNYDLDQINKFRTNKDSDKPVAVNVASGTGNAGTINIRSDDTKSRKVEGVLTQQEILDFRAGIKKP